VRRGSDETGENLPAPHGVGDCGPVRSWLVIPAMAAATGGAAVALGVTPAIAATGAAFAAVVRLLAGDAPAALTGAVSAPLVAVASLASAGTGSLRAVLALAAAGWAVSELARAPTSVDEPALSLGAERAPLVAVVPATVAAVLDPSFAGLIAFAGLRLAASPHRPRRRWVAGVLLAGALTVALAVLAGTAWPRLGAVWFATSPHAADPRALAAAVGETLGPLTAVAALAGLAGLARLRHAELALATCVVAALLVDLRAAAVGPATVGLAGLLAGLAIGRLAAMIRLGTGQAIVGATAGALVLLPPAWMALAGRARAAHVTHSEQVTHSGRASR